MTTLKFAAKTCLFALSLTAALALPVFAQTAATAPVTPGAPIGHHGGRYEGTVSAVNASGFTITTRKGETINVVTEPKTKFGQITATPLASLKTGDAIVIRGMADDTASTVAANAIEMAGPAADTKKHGEMKNAISGTVASTVPLTITDASNKVWTVNTRPNAIVETHTPGSLSDIVVGSKVRVSGPDVADSTGMFSAKRVDVLTGDFPAEVGHMHKHKGAAADAAPAI